ncbi:aminotransferase class I/II-fold pyridoxal phosphate-dependent enzyme, partial [Candidatus Micrarchaeota archaeon]|nr:aminotransferase class I/II-fold pyridoxal phosphate-dependent enzyme [Candidatus Micrarchaeota archaeon]
MDLEEVNSLVKAEEQWRKCECINLIASENVTSPAVDAAYASDFSHRYAEGEPFKRYYNGTRYIDELEQKTTELAKQVLRARDVDLRPISGTVANIAAFAFLVKPGSLVLSNATAAGGHISHNSRGAVGLVGGKPVAFPVAEDYFHLDVDKTIALIEEKSKSENQAERISTLVFGCSLFLFPQPIREIAPAAKASGCRIAFDAAHVLGLVAAGLFQDPLREGAELMTSSTHKTFFGPQGGLIASELSDEEWGKCKSRVFPGVTSNHHLHRIPALAVALLEFQKFGAEYARQVVANAKAFAQALSEAGFKVCGEEFGFTESHQVAIDV